MDYDPLVIEQGAELIRKFADHFPISAAFWLRRDEEDYKYLYIASVEIDSTSRGRAYASLAQILDEMYLPYLDIARILLISDEDHFAVAAQEYNQETNTPTKLWSAPFAGRTILDAYIYPLQMSPSFPRR